MYAWRKWKSKEQMKMGNWRHFHLIKVSYTVKHLKGVQICTPSWSNEFVFKCEIVYSLTIGKHRELHWFPWTLRPESSLPTKTLPGKKIKYKADSIPWRAIKPNPTEETSISLNNLERPNHPRENRSSSLRSEEKTMDLVIRLYFMSAAEHLRGEDGKISSA